MNFENRNNFKLFGPKDFIDFIEVELIDDPENVKILSKTIETDETNLGLGLMEVAAIVALITNTLTIYEKIRKAYRTWKEKKEVESDTEITLVFLTEMEGRKEIKFKSEEELKAQFPFDLFNEQK